MFNKDYVLFRFEWNEDKNNSLKANRNISFEDVVFSIQNSNILDIVESPTHKGQDCFVLNIDNYAYIIPFVYKDTETIFLKTIYPSRKHTKFYNLKG
jgi:uncharacterized DUF497 family protein